jgi:hypothetical protein
MRAWVHVSKYGASSYESAQAEKLEERRAVPVNTLRINFDFAQSNGIAIRF